MDTKLIAQSRLMEDVCLLTFCGTKRENTLTLSFLDELWEILRMKEEDPLCKVIVLRGNSEFFCSGMDFDAVRERQTGNESYREKFLALLERLFTIQKVTIAFVEGKALAGGVGLATACDLVAADNRAEFSLPEALWGMLPVLIMPFITRRTGFHTAMRMSLGCAPLTAQEAKAVNLVDVIAGEAELKRLCFRITRLESGTIAQIKDYFAKQFPVSQVAKSFSLGKSNELMRRHNILDNMVQYQESRKMPWE